MKSAPRIFPDRIFREYVAENIDKNQDGLLSAEEIAAVTKLDVSLLSRLDSAGVSATELSQYGIASLQGIEFFTALEVLNCSVNKLTELDVSKNTKLKELECYSNQLKTLDISENINLELLNCSINQLTELDISKNVNLKIIHCISNQLATLDTSHNPKLETLDCNCI